MMMGLLGVGHFASATVPIGNTVLSTPEGDAAPGPDMLLAEFEDLLAGDVAMPGEGPDALTDPFTQMDAWVAQVLAQAIGAEMPFDRVPALQQGAVAAPWLMQALDGREGQSAAADDAAAPQAQPGLIPMPAQGRGAGPAVVPAGVAMDAAPQQTGVPAAAVDSALADRVFNHRSVAAATATTAATPAQDDIATGAAQASNTRTPRETVLPAGVSVMATDGLTRTASHQGELPAATAPSAARVPTESQQKLVDALGERLSVQTVQGMRHAVIRLDPHLNGSVRIELRQDASGIAVHLSATNADVVRQLQAIGESLRQELGARHGGDVTVQVSASRQGHADADTSGGRERHARDDAEQGPGRGLAAAGGDGAFEVVSRDAARTQKETV